MTTYTESELVNYIAATLGPHDLKAEDALWLFVCEENRSAPFEVKAQRYARMVADCARRRRHAQVWLDAHPVIR